MSAAGERSKCGKHAAGSASPAFAEPHCDLVADDLKQAIVNGDTVQLRAALATGAAINFRDETGLAPIHLAAMHGHAEIARVLLDAAADINKKSQPPSCQTPLAIAASEGHRQVYEVLWQAVSSGDATSNSSESSDASDISESPYDSEGSEASENASAGSLERYTLDGAWERDKGVWGMAERRVAYRLRRHSHFRHLHAPDTFSVRGAASAELAYVVVPGLLSHAEIAEVHAAGRQPSAQRCADRSAELVYDHVAYRFEGELRARARQLYRRLLGVMVWAELVLWGSLRDCDKVYPEVEYISYDGKPASKEYAIDPHVDNRSLVTLVCMLSRRSDFGGGTLGFEPGCEGDDAADRHEAPEPGTAVIFRGEELQHWVSPVTSGKRYVLQIEFSSV